MLGASIAFGDKMYASSTIGGGGSGGTGGASGDVGAGPVCEAHAGFVYGAKGVLRSLGSVTTLSPPPPPPPHYRLDSG